MRHFLVLAPLGMLLLSSCEPDGGGPDASVHDRKRQDKWPEKTLADEVSAAQIAAQDSLGKPPPPRNLTATVEDICPVHHGKMTLREIPIVFEESATEGSASLTAKFPFGAEKIVSTGNVLLPGEPRTARVYQCASCIAARRLAEARQTPSEPAAEPE